MRFESSPRRRARGALVSSVSSVRVYVVVAMSASVACGTPRLPAPARVAISPSASLGASSATADPRGPTSDHADALGRLLDAPIGARLDRKHVVTLPMPDGAAWTHVKFWTVTTLAGYRYGDDHHAALAVFAFAPSPGSDGRDVDRCAKRFAAWGERRGRKFDVHPGDARVDTIAWSGNGGATQGVRVFVLDAARRTLFGTKRYASAYAAYPAWPEACLVVGVAVPAQEDDGKANAVRDRIVADTLPAITVVPTGGAAALEYAEEIGEP